MKQAQLIAAVNRLSSSICITHATSLISLSQPTIPFIMSPTVGALKDTAICLSVSLSHGAAAICYRHAGCLQISHVRTANPSADECRSAASQTAIGGGISSRRPRGDNLFRKLITIQKSTVRFF